MKHIGIVVSAGKGLRVGGDIPKQYMELCGMPVICHCLKAMQESFLDEIVVVCGIGDETYIEKEIKEKFSLDKITKIVAGGAERSDSVYNGLMAIEDPKHSYVYIQDAARPMLSVEILERLREDAECFGSAVAAVNSKDTVKLVDENGFVALTPSRSDVYIVQTPQAFKADDLMLAYDRHKENGKPPVTDDASVMELFGSLPVHISKGDYTNIKITTPEDFLTAENFLSKN